VPKVKVKHAGITDSDAKKPPKREPVPEGDYAAIIMKAVPGGTRSNPPLSKVAVEFQILYEIKEDGSKDDTIKGRRVFQDFILEPDESMPDLSERRRYELVMLLDATGVEYDDEGFDSDHLGNKTTVITVKHRQGNKPDDEGNLPTFTNVTKIDALSEGDDDDLL
jgi:hypothetical protein